MGTSGSSRCSHYTHGHEWEELGWPQCIGRVARPWSALRDMLCFQDRRIAHSAFHTLMPHERDTLVARKRLLDYMGFLLRSAVLAKEGQWDPQELYLSKRGMCCWGLVHKQEDGKWKIDRLHGTVNKLGGPAGVWGRGEDGKAEREERQL